MKNGTSGGGPAIADYVELDEASSKSYLVHIQAGSSAYEGVLYSPFPSKRLSEALQGVGDFISLKDVKDISTKETLPFMVIGKAHIETVKVLEEH